VDSPRDDFIPVLKTQDEHIFAPNHVNTTGKWPDTELKDIPGWDTSHPGMKLIPGWNNSCKRRLRIKFGVNSVNYLIGGALFVSILFKSIIFNTAASTFCKLTFVASLELEKIQRNGQIFKISLLGKHLLNFELWLGYNRLKTYCFQLLVSECRSSLSCPAEKSTEINFESDLLSCLQVVQVKFSIEYFNSVFPSVSSFKSSVSIGNITNERT